MRGDGRRSGEPLDAERFIALVGPHLDVLHRLARRLTSTRADAEDLAQEALVRAFEKRSLLREPSRIRGWLLALARNLHRNRTRDEKPHLLVLAGDREGMEAEEPAGDLERELLDRSLPDEILLALRQLPEEQATVLWLREVEQLSYEELAEAMEVPIGTVRSRLARARAAMLSRLLERRVASGGEG